MGGHHGDDLDDDDDDDDGSQVNVRRSASGVFRTPPHDTYGEDGGDPGMMHPGHPDGYR